MTIKPILWTYKLREDGSCDIKIYIRHQAKKKYISTDLKIKPEQWDEKRHQVKRNHPLAERINAKLQRQVTEIASYLLDGGALNELGKDKPVESFLVFTEQVIDEIDRGVLDFSAGTRKNYTSFLSRLRAFLAYSGRSDLKFSEVNLDFYFSFRDFLVQECGCSLQGGFSKHIKMVKSLMNMGKRRKLHNCHGHEDPEFKRYRSMESDKIYLTEAEVEKLIQIDLSHRPALALERDRFVVSYFFILRYGDSQRIQPDHFFVDEDGRRYYRLFRSQKTNKSAILPVKPLVWELLQKRNFDLSGDTNQESNRKLKTIASLAGIDQLVEQDGTKQPKWRFVTTHTARRSAATNLRLRGMDLKTIADLGGWKSTEQLRVYLRGSGLDSARVASRSSFFE